MFIQRLPGFFGWSFLRMRVQVHPIVYRKTRPERELSCTCYYFDFYRLKHSHDTK